VALTIAQKSSMNRHLGYPIVGLPVLNAAGGSFYDGSVGYRWNQSFAFLLWKQQTLNPDEEARITGNAYGSVLVAGNTQSGDIASITVSGGPLVTPVTLTYTASAQDTALTIAFGLGNLINQNATLAASGFFAIAPYGTGPYNYRPNLAPLSEVCIQNVVPFSLSASSSGSTSAAVTTNGAKLFPSIVLSDPLTNIRTQYWGYLGILDVLEMAVASASDDLDTNKADVWTARHDEIAQRETLYKNWRYRLSHFLDVPLWENVPNSHYTGMNAFEGSFV
jgi:hypothetical protein